MQNNTFESRRRLEKCRLINVLMLMETLNSATQPDMKSLMAKTGGMSL